MHKQRQSSVHSSKRKKTAQAAQTVRHKQHLACRTGGDEVEVNKKKAEKKPHKRNGLLRRQQHFTCRTSGNRVHGYVIGSGRIERPSSATTPKPAQKLGRSNALPEDLKDCRCSSFQFKLDADGLNELGHVNTIDTTYRKWPYLLNHSAARTQVPLAG